MISIVLSFLFFVQVLSEAPPAPPQNVHVDKWLLTWTPAAEDGDVSYTVQYSSFDSNEWIDSNKWIDVPACIHISDNKCDITLTKAKGEQGCVKLRVRAERRELKSVPVEACSRHGESCSPEVSLTARPGLLTVHLSSDHSLAREHGDFAKHRVYYGKEGESLEEKYKDGVSSVSISGLQEGQRYCTKVQYIYYDDAVGLPSCTQCEVIPESKTGQTGIIVILVLVLVPVFLTPLIVYVLIFRCGRIKRWLRATRYHIPENFFLEPLPEGRRPVFTCSPSEERCDVISSIDRV